MVKLGFTRSHEDGVPTVRSRSLCTGARRGAVDRAGLIGYFGAMGPSAHPGVAPDGAALGVGDGDGG